MNDSKNNNPIDSNSIEWIILNYLCEKFAKSKHNHNSTDTEIADALSGLDFAKDRLELVIAINNLLEAKFLEKDYKKIDQPGGIHTPEFVVYAVTASGYNFWKENKNS